MVFYVLNSWNAPFSPSDSDNGKMGLFRNFEHNKVGHFEKKARDRLEKEKRAENVYARFWGISGKNACLIRCKICPPYTLWAISSTRTFPELSRLWTRASVRHVISTPTSGTIWNSFGGGFDIENQKKQEKTTKKKSDRSLGSKTLIAFLVVPSLFTDRFFWFSISKTTPKTMPVQKLRNMSLFSHVAR